MTTASPTPDRDYPQLLGERGLIEPAPRRVRGYSTRHSYSTPPAPITSGRSRTTRSITSPQPMCAWST